MVTVNWPGNPIENYFTINGLFCLIDKIYISSDPTVLNTMVTKIEWDTSTCSGLFCTSTTCLTCTDVLVDASTVGTIPFYIRIKFLNGNIYVFSNVVFNIIPVVYTC